MTIFLFVSDPPHRVKIITNQNKMFLPNIDGTITVGPVDEGDSLQLGCQVEGGKYD